MVTDREDARRAALTDAQITAMAERSRLMRWLDQRDAERKRRKRDGGEPAPAPVPPNPNAPAALAAFPEALHDP